MTMMADQTLCLNNLQQERDMNPFLYVCAKELSWKGMSLLDGNFSYSILKFLMYLSAKKESANII